MARNLNVQTPGEAPATNPDDQKPVADLQPETSANDTPAPVDVEALQARIAELEAEVAKKQAADPEKNRQRAAAADAEFDRASGAITRADRDKFKNMSADEVDASKLVAAVLTKDGWVAPDQSGQKAKE